MKYNGRMDKECKIICDALNSLPGVETTESCQGHGDSPFRIWFKAKTVKNVQDIYERLSSGWDISVSHSDVPNFHIEFLLTGPKNVSVDDATLIAHRINPKKVLK